jgi:hypothetical protein
MNRNSNNITTAGLLALVAVAVGCLGYFVGTAEDRSIARLAVDGVVPLEYYASARSFSEIENTRAVLDALAARYVQQARVLLAREYVHRTAHPTSGDTSHVRPRLLAIRLLEDGFAQFQGTDHVGRLIPTLL